MSTISLTTSANLQQATMKCRFCHRPAVATFHLDAGCLCFPDEREHGYCIQHILRARPMGNMELREVLQQEEFDFFVEWQREDSPCRR